MTLIERPHARATTAARPRTSALRIWIVAWMCTALPGVAAAQTAAATRPVSCRRSDDCRLASRHHVRHDDLQQHRSVLCATGPRVQRCLHSPGDEGWRTHQSVDRYCPSRCAAEISNEYRRCIERAAGLQPVPWTADRVRPHGIDTLRCQRLATVRHDRRDVGCRSGECAEHAEPAWRTIRHLQGSLRYAPVQGTVAENMPRRLREIQAAAGRARASCAAGCRIRLAT